MREILFWVKELLSSMSRLLDDDFLLKETEDFNIYVRDVWNSKFPNENSYPFCETLNVLKLQGFMSRLRDLYFFAVSYKDKLPDRDQDLEDQFERVNSYMNEYYKILDANSDVPFELEKGNYVLVQKGVNVYKKDDIYNKANWTTPVQSNHTEVYEVKDIMLTEKGTLVEICHYRYLHSKEHVPQLLLPNPGWADLFLIKLEDVAFYAKTKQDALKKYNSSGHSDMKAAFNPYLLSS
ncbi:hypothetical protein N9E76_00785 [bacterium]|nr:hypothetical protein [bacterium]